MSRERILIGGAPGTGKTFDWLTIARALPKSTFHVIDPDDGTARVWKGKNKSGEPEFPTVNNLNYYFTPTWKGDLKPCSHMGEVIGQVGGIKNAFKEIQKKCKPDDWVVVEMLSNIWSMLQGEFVDQVFDQDIGDYFLEVRKHTAKNANKLEALSGWMDWNVINKMHNGDLIVPICYNLPCHVIATTSVSVQQKADPKEDAEIRAFYGDTLIRFEGQKQNPFRMQSMFLKKRIKDKFIINTFVKDRGREWLDNVELFDFALQYLGPIAGWEL